MESEVRQITLRLLEDRVRRAPSHVAVAFAARKTAPLRDGARLRWPPRLKRHRSYVTNRKVGASPVASVCGGVSDHMERSHGLGALVEAIALLAVHHATVLPFFSGTVDFHVRAPVPVIYGGVPSDMCSFTGVSLPAS